MNTREHSKNSIDLRNKVSDNIFFGITNISNRRVVQVEIGSNNSIALRSEDSETLVAAAQTARKQKIPLICYLASSGTELSEGVAAIHGWGMAAREFVACSGVVPIICCVTGPAVSGPALLIGLADIVVMIEDTYAFVSGPQMVKRFTGENLTNESLGGSSMHLRTSGVAHFIASNRQEATELIEEILGFLPNSTDTLPQPDQNTDPTDRSTPEAGEILPDASSGSYDVRRIVECIVDYGNLIEPRASFAPNLVTAFGRIGGRPVGIVANQPQSIAGTLDIPSSQKGARFVAFCDAFNLPLITFVDTSGFYPGKDLEWRGMIRYGAQMAFAYARATVPRLCLILRKSYGGAYIVMDSRYMGNDLMLAWPSAEIAVMGAKGAIQILHRDASEQQKAALESEYENRLLNPYIAAERGSVDRVIEPADTRQALSSSLELLINKRERLPQRRHDNTPL